MIGGIQRHSRLLAEALAESDAVDLTVIHPHAGTRVFDPSLGIREIAIKPERPSGTYLLDCYRYSGQVLREVQQMPQHLVYAQGLSVWKGLSRIGQRVILNPHGLEAFQSITPKDQLAGFPFRAIMRYQFRRCACVVSLGGRLTAIIEKNAGSAMVARLPNAVELPPPVQRDYNNPVTRFLFVGRFAYNKGIDVLLQAARELNDEGLSAQTGYNLVGTGPLLEELSKKYVLPNLNFIGFASDEKLSLLYSENDIFVLPTLFEGMPTVVLEAMANGMPVIVTDTGATRDMVDESNGIIIEKKDVRSLKDAIRKFIVAGPEFRESCSRASFEKVKSQFTWRHVAEEHIRLFMTLKNKMGTHA
jgi:glycosyltransferase involved in cell wall biosynthesis